MPNSLCLAQQYSYGVYDYAYADPSYYGVDDSSSVSASDGDYFYDPTAYEDGYNYGEASSLAPYSATQADIEALTDWADQINQQTDAASAVVPPTTETVPAPKGMGEQVQGIFSEYWVQFLALLVSVIGVALAVSGFSFANKKKQKYLRKYLHEIDDAYSSYKWKSKRCEAELYRLQDLVEDNLKDGKIDENTFNLLENRIKKYLDEIKYADERPVNLNSRQAANEETHSKIAKDLTDQLDEIGEAL